MVEGKRVALGGMIAWGNVKGGMTGHVERNNKEGARILSKLKQTEKSPAGKTFGGVGGAS